MKEFSQDLDKPELLIDHPIFDEVFDLQRRLENECYDTYEDAAIATFPHLEKYHAIVTADGLIEKEVTLSGFDIIVPRFGLDHETGTENLAIESVQSGGQLGSRHDTITGSFYGFSPVIKEDDQGFSVNIHYRVATEYMFLNSFVGMACAQGDLSSTTLEFTDDMQKIASAKAAQDLFDASFSEEAQKTATHVHELLTPQNDADLFKAIRLRKIGRALRQLETSTGVIDPDYRESMINYVTTRLGIYDTAIFAMSAMNIFIRTAEEKPSSPRFQRFDEIQFDGLTFTPFYKIKGEEPVLDTDQGMLSLATRAIKDQKEVPVYVPLERLRKLKPLQ